MSTKTYIKNHKYCWTFLIYTIIACILAGCRRDQKALDRSSRLSIQLKDMQHLDQSHQDQIAEFAKFYHTYKCKFVVLVTYAGYTPRNVIRNRIKHIRQLFDQNDVPNDHVIIVENHGSQSTVQIIMRFIDIL
jgi:RNase P protein component